MNKLKITPLGGLGEIGINMMAYQFGDDILVVDMGYGFPKIPSINHIIPNSDWLVENKHRIRGIVITHGHMDHIGAIPYILPRLGFPPIYSLPLTIGLIKKRLEEFNLNGSAKCISVQVDDQIQLGAFKVRFFRVNHSIPDAVGLSILTPSGQVIHTGDWKLDYTPGDDHPAELAKLLGFSEQGVLALLSDSTNAPRPGFSISEKQIAETIDNTFKQATNRIIFTCNALILTRIQQVFNIAAKHNRQVAVIGRSMINNIEVASRLGYLKIKPGTMIKMETAKRLPGHRTVILTTGAQGEELASLPRMARGEHRDIRLKKGDTVIISANPIPGNERTVNEMIQMLSELGVTLVYSRILDIHVSGHAKQSELKLLIDLVKPQFFIPIHGEHHMLVAHRALAEELGIPTDNVFVMDNGKTLELDKDGAKILPELIDTRYHYADDLGSGFIDPELLEEQEAMQNDGIVSIVMPLNKQSRALTGQATIASRGFVYVKGNEGLFRELGHDLGKMSVEITDETIVQHAQQYLFARTGRRPMIVPAIIEV